MATTSWRAKLYNNPDGRYATMIYWLDLFVLDCEARLKLKSAVKGVKLPSALLRLPGERGLRREAIGTAQALQGADRAAGRNAKHGAGILRDQRATRPRQARQPRSFRTFGVFRVAAAQFERARTSGESVRPNSGIQPNTETKRDRYVSHNTARCSPWPGGRCA